MSIEASTNGEDSVTVAERMNEKWNELREKIRQQGRSVFDSGSSDGREVRSGCE
jgi:hypothetical protein